ncbi:hypothetical protein NEOKW01_1324 [Nematocida sp. AWRm80]|nr:hypothetical protein NEOKW01_1324 [Nematocida sp. AWRm80]
MKFTFRRQMLPQVTLLEFRGEFEAPQEIKMQLLQNRIYFTHSFIEGEPQDKTGYILLERTEDRLIPSGTVNSSLVFNKAPKYIVSTSKENTIKRQKQE